MRVQEVLDKSLVNARQMKEHACRRRPHDIAPCVDVYRGDREVASIVLRGSFGRNEVLDVAGLATIGYDADIVAVTVDAYGSNSGISPVTGKHWAPGEMQAFTKEHADLAAELIQECLVVTVVNRAADTGWAELCYRYAGKHLVWGKESLGDPELVGGEIPERLAAAMLIPSASTLVANEMTLNDLTRGERDRETSKLIRGRYSCDLDLFTEEDE